MYLSRTSIEVKVLVSFFLNNTQPYSPDTTQNLACHCFCKPQIIDLDTCLWPDCEYPEVEGMVVERESCKVSDVAQNLVSTFVRVKEMDNFEERPWCWKFGCVKSLDIFDRKLGHLQQCWSTWNYLQNILKFDTLTTPGYYKAMISTLCFSSASSACGPSWIKTILTASHI